MATYTSNYNLYKPDTSDDFADFRAEHNNNMDIIDANLGGGGGSGGHTIIDENGSDMPAESKLQFTGNVSVTDDNVNGKTIVDILGGTVYGAFIDTDNVISNTIYRSSMSYLATQDCYVAFYIVLGAGATYLDIDGEHISTFYNTNIVGDTTGVYLKKGQTVSVSNANANIDGNYVVYGIKQGTNGIFAPVIYSDNERVIGVWRDNKPLYQKTFLFHSTDSQGNYVFQDVSSLNIDSCVEIKGTCDRNVAGLGAIIYDMNSFESNQYQTYLGYSAFNGKIQYTIKLPVGETTTWQVITIRYTKTTDVAGSGNWNTDGVPTHHYSTSEQVIGTWIDGKPLYERTFDFNNQVIPDNTWSNNILGGNLPTIQIKSYDGYFGLENTDWSANFNYIRNNDGGFNEFFTANSTGSDISVRPNMNAGVNVVLRTCTVRYTKSTD